MNSVNNMPKDRFITVNDKRFHYTWLRDNCLQLQSRHPDSWEKLESLNDRTLSPEPLSVVEQDGNLVVEWNESPPHRSVFPITWLLNHAYDPQPQTPPKDITLWDKAMLETNQTALYHSCSADIQSWIDQFFSLGFVILRDINPDHLDSILSSIGPICDTEYGRIVTATVGKGLSSTVKALPPHNDLTYASGDRLVQFIYCAENSTSGGESLVVDGFRVAHDFRQDYPHYFQILVETSLPFWRVQHEHQYFFSSEKAIIELDRKGDLATIHFSQKNCMPRLPFDQVESFYEAYAEFSRYMHNLDYRYCFRLQPGDCLLMQNFRILHGRSTFDPSTGSREMRVGYIGLDYFLARYFYHQEFKKNQHKVDSN